MSYRLSLLLVTCLTCLGVIPVSPLGLRVNAGATLQETTNSTDTTVDATVTQPPGTDTPIMELAQSESSPSPSTPPSPTPELPDLSAGSQGQAVIQLQTILQELGHYGAAIDGQYGESTTEAVSKFQQEAGLETNGRVGAETWERLIAAQTTDALETTSPADAPATDSESEPAQATESASRSGLTWWILSFLVVLGVAGGLFYFLRMEKLEAKRSTSPLRGGLADQSPTLETPTRQYFPNGSNRDLVHSEVVSGHMEDASDMEGTSRLSKIDIVQELVRDLHSPDPSKRRKAIWELGQRGDSQSLQPLVDMMIDADSSQRNLILAAISEIGVRSLKPVNRALLISLQDNSPDVRKNAIRDLTRIYDQVAQVSHLLRHAAEDGDDEVRETARWALGQLNRIKTLTEALPDSGTNSAALPNPVKQEQLPQDSSANSNHYAEESKSPGSNHYSENSSGSNYYSEDASVSGTNDSNSNSTNETFW
jgi:peptidoglycan hydrolase-like protein with peptidoglycan-binding domain